jgi:cyclase
MPGKDSFRTILIYIGLLLFFSVWGYAQQRSSLVRISNDIYARIVNPNGNAVGNSGIIILEHGVIVFDTHFTPEAGFQLKEEIRSITSKTVTYIVNSHFHPDHTHGNQAFPDAIIIGSQPTRRDILQKDLPSLNQIISVTNSQLEKIQNAAYKEEDPKKIDAMQKQIKARKGYLNTLSHLKLSAPLIILEDYLTFHDGSREINILYLGAGHTEGDIILYMPSEKTAFLGDLFFNNAIPNVQDAKILQWMDTLGILLKLEADRFIPGHGPVGTREDVRRFLDYFKDLRALVEPFVGKGYSLEQVMSEIKLPPKYSGYQFMNLFPDNVQKMYAEIKMQLLSDILIEGPKKPEK